MVSKSSLIGAVVAVSVLSVGTGTYLAYRANQTATPGAQAFVPASSPVHTSGPAPSPVSDASSVALNATKSSERAESASTKTPAKPEPRDTTVPASSESQSGAAVPPPVASTTTSAEAPPVPVPATAAAATGIETPVTSEPAKPRFEEVTIKEDTVIGIRLDQAISSETARVEDRVSAKVTRDVTVDGRTAVAAGTRLEGVVSMVERGTKFRDKAKLGIKFNTLILADGLRVPIQTEIISREGESPANDATKKIGVGAVAGTILGGVLGGKRGAVIGATAGAGAGTGAVMAGDRNAATFVIGAPLTVHLVAPVKITIERDPAVR